VGEVNVKNSKMECICKSRYCGKVHYHA